jgi:hypothetical protein
LLSLYYRYPTAVDQFLDALESICNRFVAIALLQSLYCNCFAVALLSICNRDLKTLCDRFAIALLQSLCNRFAVASLQLLCYRFIAKALLQLLYNRSATAV